MNIERLEHAGRNFVAMTPAELEAGGVPPDAILAAVKSVLKVEVDDEAERIRVSLVTPGSGQAMEYQEAQAQAAAALADASATAAEYPMLAATIGLDIDPETGEPATDVKGVARSVLAARDLWLVMGAEIRKTRIGGKLAIEAADTIEAAHAARAGVTWPTP